MDWNLRTFGGTEMLIISSVLAAVQLMSPFTDSVYHMISDIRRSAKSILLDPGLRMAFCIEKLWWSKEEFLQWTLLKCTLARIMCCTEIFVNLQYVLKRKKLSDKKKTCTGAHTQYGKWETFFLHLLFFCFI